MKPSYLRNTFYFLHC